MSKFKIGDRVKFHIEAHPEEDDTVTVCLGPWKLPPDDYWVKWDGDGEVQQSSEMYLTLIGSPTKEELHSSFKIDVQAYADENNISLEQAHNEIQPWLFEHGYGWESWKSGRQKEVLYVNNPYLFCGTEYIAYGNDSYYFNVQSAHKQIFLSRNVSISLSVKEEEIVEILGKKYRKSDVENAMKNVKEKE